MVMVAWLRAVSRVSSSLRPVACARLAAQIHPGRAGGRWPGGPAAVGQGGPWLRRTRLPSGLVNVVVPSPFSAIVQPHRWIAIRW
jgi:hypothetical protein